jgi:hypothetical protein
VARDVVFGGSFALTKLKMTSLFEYYHCVHPTHSPSHRWISFDPQNPAYVIMSPNFAHFINTAVSGFLATALSSPFNYARNIKFACPSNQKPPSTYYVLSTLVRDVVTSPNPVFNAVDRLKIGWGTLRVAIGMALGQYLYDRSKNYLDSLSK